MYDVHIEVESLVYIYVYVGSRTIFFPVIIFICVFIKLSLFSSVIQPEECPGIYCGRRPVGPGLYTDCGVSAKNNTYL